MYRAKLGLGVPSKADFTLNASFSELNGSAAQPTALIPIGFKNSSSRISLGVG